MITLKRIKNLRPCTDRLDNYVSFYGNREFTKSEFMGLKNITHDDKLWVAFRLMPNGNLGKAAGEIAKTVLHVYESEYPNDNRPRLAVEAAIAGTVTEDIINDAYVAYATACTAYVSAAAHAAYAAAYATPTDGIYVHVALHINYAPTSDFFSYAYGAAASASAVVAKNPTQEKLIRKICLKYWKET